MCSLGTSARGGAKPSEPENLCACRFFDSRRNGKPLDLAGFTAFAMYLAQAYPQILTARPYPAAVCKNFGALPLLLHTPPRPNWLRPWCFASLTCAVWPTHCSVGADPRHIRASPPWTPSVRSPGYRPRSHGRRRGFLFLRFAVSADVASSPDPGDHFNGQIVGLVGDSRGSRDERAGSTSARMVLRAGPRISIRAPA
jgi:hypothetical protein